MAKDSKKNAQGLCDTPYCRGVITKHDTCRTCRKCRDTKQRETDPEAYYYRVWKGNVSRRRKKATTEKQRYDFTVTLEEFRQFCKETNYMALKGRGKTKCAIDRIRVNEGYHFNNLQILTNSLNSHKRNAEYSGYGTGGIDFNDPEDPVPF
jgi:hypothetical protein